MSTDFNYEKFLVGSKQYINDIKDELSLKQLKELCKLYVIALKAFKDCKDMPNYIFIDSKFWQKHFWDDNGIIFWSEKQRLKKDISYESVLGINKIQAFCTIFLYGNGLKEKMGKSFIYANSYRYEGFFNSYEIKELFDINTAREAKSTLAPVF